MKTHFISAFFILTIFLQSATAQLISECPIDNLDDVVVFCTGDNNLGITFPARTTSENAKGFYLGSTGCLSTTPSPSWFIMQIEDSGMLGITMNHSEREDIDFACWGPFEGKTKSEVLSKICNDPDKYFKSPNEDGDPYINMCELAYVNFIRKATKECFEAKTGVSYVDAYLYPNEYYECEEYAYSIVPQDIENDYNRTSFYYPEDEEVADCYYKMKPEEIMMVDCSYSSESVEECIISNAKKGEWYLLLITNYSEKHGNIFFKKTGGTASTNCKIIVDAISTGPYCEGDDIYLKVNNAPSTATFEWRGPNGFVSQQAEPIIPHATALNAGSYYVVMHNADVTSDEVEVEVVVNQPIVRDTSVFIAEGNFYEFGGEKITEVGKYQHTFESAAGCDSTVNLTVKMIGVPSAWNETICEGDDITIDLEIEDGGIGHTMKWSGPNGFSSNEETPTLSNVSVAMSGLYKATITFGNGNVYVGEAKLTVAVSQASEQKVYLIKGDSIVFGDEVIKDAGTYTKQLVNSAGCDSVVVLEVKLIDATLSNTGPYCEGETIQLEASGIPDELNIEWVGPNGFTSQSTSPTIANAQITDAGSYSLYIKEEEPAQLLATTDVVVMKNVMEKIIEQLLYGDTLYFGELVITSGGEYKQSYASAEGCDSVVTLVVTMKLDEYAVVKPSEFFTPNGDGINDVWEIENVELYDDAIITIYNRQGKVIREYTAYDNLDGWDGKDINGNDLPSADYWYTINIGKVDKIYVGHITLMR